MKHRRNRRAAVRFVATIAAALAMSACTVVYIEGDGNSVSDTGGHGGGVQLPARTDGGAHLLERLQPGH